MEEIINLGVISHKKGKNELNLSVTNNIDANEYETKTNGRC
jgi:hypothetical protein